MNRKEIGLRVLVGSMELCWLYPIFAMVFVNLGFGNHFLTVMAIYFFAALTTKIFQGKGLVVYQLLFLHLGGSILATLYLCYSLFYGQTNFFNKLWLSSLFTSTKEPMEWLILILLIIFAYIIWFRGFALVRRPVDYIALSNSFDLGVGILFFLLLIDAGIGLSSIPLITLVSFFFFSILAMGISGNEGSEDSEKSYLPGFRGMGLVLTFAVVIVIIGVGLGLLFLPHLITIAETSYKVVRVAGEPFLSYIIKALVFLIGFSVPLSPTETTTPSAASGLREPLPVNEGSWLSVIIEKVISYGLIGIVIVLGLGVAVGGLYFAYKVLLSRTSINKENVNLKEIIFYLYTSLLSKIKEIRKKTTPLFSGKKSGREGARLFKKLLKWGKLSGIAYEMNETPREYGHRLINNFPQFRTEILLVIESFNLEVYGDKPLNNHNLNKAKVAIRKLTSPLNIPLIIKAWFSR